MENDEGEAFTWINKTNTGNNFIKKGNMQSDPISFQILTMNRKKRTRKFCGKTKVDLYMEFRSRKIEKRYIFRKTQLC